MTGPSCADDEPGMPQSGTRASARALILLTLPGPRRPVRRLHPAWQAPDEPAHYNYIRYLAETGRFPVLQMGDYPHDYLEEIKSRRFPPDLSIDPIRYEYHQPPLYYSLAAPVYLLAKGRPPAAAACSRLPWARGSCCWPTPPAGASTRAGRRWRWPRRRSWRSCPSTWPPSPRSATTCWPSFSSPWSSISWSAGYRHHRPSAISHRLSAIPNPQSRNPQIAQSFWVFSWA